MSEETLPTFEGAKLKREAKSGLQKPRRQRCVIETCLSREVTEGKSWSLQR